MYNFDEGAIELPGEWTDRSIHLFDRPVDGGAIAMVITREVMAEGATLEGAADDLLKGMAPRLRRFELVERGPDATIGVPAVRVRYRFFHPDMGAATSVQAMLRHQDRMLTIAMTAPARHEDEMLRSFDGIVRSLRLRKKLT